MQDLQHLLGLHAVVKAVQLSSGQLQGELDIHIQMMAVLSMGSIWQQGTILYHLWRYVCFSCYTSSRESLQYKETGIK